MNLNGRIVVVTGAAPGIGRASALALARGGCGAIVIADVDAAGAAETVRLVEKESCEARFVSTDVRQIASLERLVEATMKEYGGFDILHNNAGLVSGGDPWPSTLPARIADVIAVNVLGVLVGTRLAIDVMRRRGGGAIVNTASVAGLAPLPFDAVYAATKAAVISFTQSCAPLRESIGVRVNAVLPALVDTPIIAKTGDGTNPAEWLKPALVGGIALKAEHIAAAVVSLVEDDTKAGETLVVRSPPAAPR